MSAFEIFAKIFGRDPTLPENAVRMTMRTLYALNVSDLMNAAAAWQPKPTQCEFKAEINARLAYLDGSMQADMLEVLKRRFKDSHAEIDQEQVNLRTFQKQCRDQAKIFSTPWKFKLVDKSTGDEADPKSAEQKALDEMVSRGGFNTTLIDIDRKIHAIHRLGAKVWWDARHKCVRVAVWPQQFVHWVLNPQLYWDTDSAAAFGVEWPSENGVRDSAGSRVEIWIKRKVGDRWISSVYFATSGGQDQDWKEQEVNGNPNMLNPFIDPETKEPIFPISWWRDDARLDVYWVGDEDALTINRMLNSALTDVNWGMHYGQHPMVSWKTDAGSAAASAPARTLVGPGFTLPEVGIHPVFTHPDYDPKPAMDLWMKLVDIDGKIAGSSPKALSADGGAPESGYKLKVENQPLEEHRNEQIPIYIPQVVDTLRRGLIVQNTYATEAGLSVVDLTKWGIKCIPSSISLPVDEEAQGRTHAARREANVETAVDERMELTGEDEKEAEQKIRENAALNKELASIGRQEFSPFPGNDDQPPKGPPKAPPKGPPEEPPTGDEEDQPGQGSEQEE